MKKKSILLCLLLAILIFTPLEILASEKNKSIGIAVEFMDHAASVYVGRDKGWF